MVIKYSDAKCIVVLYGNPVVFELSYTNKCDLKWTTWKFNFKKARNVFLFYWVAYSIDLWSARNRSISTNSWTALYNNCTVLSRSNDVMKLITIIIHQIQREIKWRSEWQRKIAIKHTAYQQNTAANIWTIIIPYIHNHYICT